MNQTKKRLNIINLAITMTDIETIQMQTMKLNMLKSDKKLQKIIKTLHTQNYAKAQELINTYMEENHDEVIQRTQQNQEALSQEEVQELEELTKKYEQAKEEAEKEEKKKKEKEKPKLQTNIHYSDLISLQELRESTQKKRQESDKKIDKKEDNKPKKNTNLTENRQKEMRIETKEDSPHLSLTNDMDDPDVSNKDFESFDNFLKDSKKKKLPLEKVTIDIAHTSHEENELLLKLEEENQTKERANNEMLKESETQNIETLSTEERVFEAVPHIEQRFKNLYNLYPPLYESDTTYLSVDSLLLQLSNENFSEQTILTVLSDINHIANLDKAEAAELLLVSAATEITFAKFMLARELYKGSILEKNIPEAFMLMQTLANEGLGEAMCDLGQFYENGIGTDHDEQKALELYKIALEHDVERAKPHFKRLKKKNKGFLGFMK
jgi:hypothetical protein